MEPRDLAAKSSPPPPPPKKKKKKKKYKKKYKTKKKKNKNKNAIQPYGPMPVLKSTTCNPATFHCCGMHFLLSCRASMSLRNRCLMFMIWLRRFSSYFFLSTLFDISVTQVHYIIRKPVPIFRRHLQAFVMCDVPTMNEWGSIRGAWPQLPNAVGSIDGTSHEIYRRIVEPQKHYYAGHRQYHAIRTQIIVDNCGI